MRFGIDEIGKPSPKWMERLWTALTMFIFPACAAYILALPADVMSEHTKNILGASGTFFLAVFKGLKFLFSDVDSATE
jgi:hypothetical protein